jgi:hypothetical protein
MEKRFILPSIGGDRDLTVPIYREEKPQEATVSHTSGWMVDVNDVTAGNVEAFPTYVELFGYFSKLSRFVSGNVSHALFTSGSVKLSEVIFVIQNGEHGPKIEHKMYSGTIIPFIKIVRLGWSQDALSILQEITYTEVRVVFFSHNIQYMVFGIQARTRTNDISEFQQIDGVCSGHKISKMNYSENTLEFESQ